MTAHSPLIQTVTRIQRRFWWQRMLRAIDMAFWLAAIAAVGCIFISFFLTPVSISTLLVIVVLSVFGGMTRGAIHGPPSRPQVALQVDRWLGTHEMITTALYLSHQHPPCQSVNAITTRQLANDLCTVRAREIMDKPALRFNGYIPVAIILAAAFATTQPQPVPVFEVALTRDSSFSNPIRNLQSQDTLRDEKSGSGAIPQEPQGPGTNPQVDAADGEFEEIRPGDRTLVPGYGATGSSASRELPQPGSNINTGALATVPIERIELTRTTHPDVEVIGGSRDRFELSGTSIPPGQNAIAPVVPATLGPGLTHAAEVSFAITAYALRYAKRDANEQP